MRVLVISIVRIHFSVPSKNIFICQNIWNIYTHNGSNLNNLPIIFFNSTFPSSIISMCNFPTLIRKRHLSFQLLFIPSLCHEVSQLMHNASLSMAFKNNPSTKNKLAKHLASFHSLFILHPPHSHVFPVATTFPSSMDHYYRYHKFSSHDTMWTQLIVKKIITYDQVKHYSLRKYPFHIYHQCDSSSSTPNPNLILMNHESPHTTHAIIFCNIFQVKCCILQLNMKNYNKNNW